MMRLGLICVLTCLTSCVSYAPQQPLQPHDLNVVTDSKEVADTSYQLGVEKSVYVGEPVARVRKYTAETVSIDKFVTTEEVTLNPVPGKPRSFPAGTKLTTIGKVPYEGRDYIEVRFDVGTPYEWYHPLINADGSFSGYFYAQLNRIVLANGKAAEFTPDHFVLARERAEQASSSGPYVNFELIYSGASNDSINLLYREYTADDMARPAFSQNLVYERDAAIIRFRNLVIDVKEANNERFRYIVRED